MWARVVTTPAFMLSVGTIREMDWSFPAVARNARIAFPPGESDAPRTKSICPPTPEKTFGPMESATTCPVRSTSMQLLMETTSWFCLMVAVSFTRDDGRNWMPGLSSTKSKSRWVCREECRAGSVCICACVCAVCS
jgi:hypothetical protein